MISYAGPFTTEYRQQLLQQFLAFVQQRNIPMGDAVNPLDVRSGALVLAFSSWLHSRMLLLSQTLSLVG